MPASRILAALAVTMLAAATLEAETPIIVVHPSVEDRSVSRSELSKIFLKRLRSWQDGQSARPVDQVPGPMREAFSEAVHDRSMITIEIYWKRLIYAGRDVPPPEAGSDEAVLDFVRSTPGAVGYVSSTANLEGVLTLQVE